MIGGNARQLRQDVKELRRQIRQVSRANDSSSCSNEGGTSAHPMLDSGRVMPPMGATEFARRRWRTSRIVRLATRVIPPGRRPLDPALDNGTPRAGLLASALLRPPEKSGMPMERAAAARNPLLPPLASHASQHPPHPHPGVPVPPTSPKSALPFQMAPPRVSPLQAASAMRSLRVSRDVDFELSKQQLRETIRQPSMSGHPAE